MGEHLCVGRGRGVADGGRNDGGDANHHAMA